MKGRLPVEEELRSWVTGQGSHATPEELEGSSDVIYLQLFLFLMGKGSPGGDPHLT